MKILYAIQGTGNGHICRARAIIPLLQEHGSVDVLVSGTQADIDTGHEVKYRLHGLGFIFGKNGGVDIMATYRKNRIRRFWKELRDLPVEVYDLVINDFEPVSAWACHLKGIPVIGMSHQAAVLNKRAPKAKNSDTLGRSVLKHYAPVTDRYGFHFEEYDQNIFLPVIRPEVRSLQPRQDGHYTVYLPAYADKKLLKILGQFEDVRWEVFSKHCTETSVQGNISIQPVNNGAFLQSMAHATGVLCGAGFETPAEAMFLKKKLLVIPMKGQYEQQCNAAALRKLGVTVIKSLKDKQVPKIRTWIDGNAVVPAHYPDRTREIIETILQHHSGTAPKPSDHAAIFTFKKFRQQLLTRILSGLSKQ